MGGMKLETEGLSALTNQSQTTEATTDRGRDALEQPQADLFSSVNAESLSFQLKLLNGIFIVVPFGGFLCIWKKYSHRHRHMINFWVLWPKVRTQGWCELMLKVL